MGGRTMMVIERRIEMGRNEVEVPVSASPVSCYAENGNAVVVFVDRDAECSEDRTEVFLLTPARRPIEVQEPNEYDYIGTVVGGLMGHWALHVFREEDYEELPF